MFVSYFTNLELLPKVIETEPKQMNSRSSMPIILKIEGSEKYMFEENIVNDNIYYSEVALKNVAEEDAQESQHGEPGDIGDRSWQENVVVVANKEHLPLESENEEPCNEHFDYETVQSGKTCDVVVELNHLNKNSETADYDGDRGVLQSRKRHIGSYSCSECHKVFPNYSRMMTHRRCHDTDRPKYPCLYCSRIYATKQAMECHIQTFHDKTGFTCSICNKVFAIRRSLQVHCVLKHFYIFRILMLNLTIFIICIRYICVSIMVYFHMRVICATKNSLKLAT